MPKRALHVKTERTETMKAQKQQKHRGPGALQAGLETSSLPKQLPYDNCKGGMVLLHGCIIVLSTELSAH